VVFFSIADKDRYLALVCIMGDDSPAERKAIVDYNINKFQDALERVWQQ